MALLALTDDTGAIVSANAATANAYLTEQFATSHLADSGLAVSGNIETLLVRASSYLDRRFGNRFTGKRASGDQSLAWPRAEATDLDGNTVPVTAIPLSILRAVAEYAARLDELGTLVPDPVQVDEARRIRVTEDQSQLGSLSQRSRREYDTIRAPTAEDIAANPDLQWIQFPDIDALVNRYTSGSGGLIGIAYESGQDNFGYDDYGYWRGSYYYYWDYAYWGGGSFF